MEDQDRLLILIPFIDNDVLMSLQETSLEPIITKFLDIPYFWFLRVEYLLHSNLEQKAGVDWKNVYYILLRSMEHDDPFTEEALSNATALDILLGTGYNPVKNDRIIDYVIENGHTDSLRLLLEDGRANPKNESVVIAAARGYTDIVQLLLQDGRIDPNYRSKMNGSIAEVTASNGRIEIMNLLLQDQRVSSSSINDALISAVEEEDIDMTRLLLEDGRLDDSTIQNMLTVAREEGYNQEIIHLLE